MWDKFKVILPYLTNLISIPLTAYFTYYFMNKHDKNVVNTATKEQITAELEFQNNLLQKDIGKLNKSIDRFTAVKQSEDGDCFILIETNEHICPTCWGKDLKAIPVYDNGTGYYICSICKTKNIYNINSKNESDTKFSELTRSMKKPNPYAGYLTNWKG